MHYVFLIIGQKLSLLEEALCKIDSSDPAIISAVIDEYSQQPYMKEKSAYHRLFLHS
jgi:3-hydroxyisobutyryl-CoA hydrolase